MKRRELLALVGTSALFSPSATSGADQPLPGKTAVQVLPTLSVGELNSLLIVDGVNPTQVYGRRFDFTGKIIAVGKAIDGGAVPHVRIDGWVIPENLYGTAYVHNVITDQIGKVGTRVKVESLIVEHGFGTLFVWCCNWVRVDA
jgi:hypothetical protein